MSGRGTQPDRLHREVRAQLSALPAHGLDLCRRAAARAHCLFAMPVEGARQGKNALVQLRAAADPATAERYKVKRYEREKTTDEDGTRRLVTVALNPQTGDIGSGSRCVRALIT